MQRLARSKSSRAFLFDLDGTLVDSVYQHVLAWREALEKSGIELAVWRIHRPIGMSGGLLIDALLREIGRRVTKTEAEHLAQLHEDAYLRASSTSGSRAPRHVGPFSLLDPRPRALGRCHQRSTCQRTAHVGAAEARTGSAGRHARPS
jgi:phosphoglycolate phosphatase-like HAD superfamily hydrolase